MNNLFYNIIRGFLRIMVFLFFHPKVKGRENIKEEIADVNIVLIKLKEMYFENNIEMIKFIGNKIRRTKELLK